MVRGVENSKKKKKKRGLMEDRDYITEAWLQGGKSIGDICKGIKKKSKKKS